MMSLAVLRPLAFGEMLDQAFGLFRRLFTPLLVISLVTNAIPSLLSIASTVAGDRTTEGLLLGIASMILSVIGAAIGTGASTFLVSDYLLGRPTDTQSALSRAWPRLGALVACSILFGFLVGLGIILLIVPGLIILSGLVLAFTVVTVENATGSDSLGRSWELTKGFKWRIFGLLCVFGAIFYGLIIGATVIGTFGLGLAGDFASDPNDKSIAVLLTVIITVAKIFVYPVLYCMVVTAYYDLRVRKDGLDLELLATTMERPATA
jgi:hypothetical protein